MKFSKVHFLLVLGLLLTLIGGLMINSAAKNCTSIDYTPGTASVTYNCPLTSSQLTKVLLSRSDAFMLEKVVFGLGVALILIWLISWLSIKYGSSFTQSQN